MSAAPHAPEPFAQIAAWQEALRRDARRLPPTAAFATKGELAQDMLARAFAAEVPAVQVAGDEVSGNDGDRRRWLESERHPYVLDVARSYAVWQEGQPVRVDAVVTGIPDDAWQRIDVGSGSKGPRVYAWVCARLPYLAQDGWAQWLLVRRCVTESDDLAFYRAFGREETKVAQLVRVAGTRWAIEEGFQRAKEVGLAQYEVRRWDRWHRHITLCLLAQAVLKVTRGGAGRKRAAAATLIPITVPEVRRLLAVLSLSQEHRAFRLHRSRWRCQRQAEARRGYDKRRARPGRIAKCRCST